MVTSNTFAQGTGKIVGKITDKKTGETLIGVSVKVTGASKGTTSDVEGRYTLGGLETGNLTVEFSYVGYPTKKISDIAAVSGKVTNLDVVMEESGQMLEAVVITATAKQESIGGLYAQQKNAISMSSGISADQIKRSPDRNTSEVLKRVSGASIQDNKFIVVRGLADRYNTTALNNTMLPSTEPDRKAFSFDIIPSSLVDRIVINKTAAPNLPGDFAGGMIQIMTKDVPDQSFLNVGTSWSYNSQSTGQDFLSNSRNSRDWLGFDDGSRSLPSQVPGSFQEYNPLSNQEKVEKTKLFSNLYPQQSSRALPVQSYQLTWGNRKTFKNSSSLGSVVSFNYRNAQTINYVTRSDYENQFQNFAYQYNDDEFRYSTVLGGLANITYKKGNNKFSFKNIYNRTFEDNYTDREGRNTNADGFIRFNNSDLTQKTMLNTQLEGDHQFGKQEKDNRLNWNVNYSLIERSQPDLRSIAYRQSFQSPEDPFTVLDRNSRRFFSDMNENNYSAQLNYTRSLSIFKNKGTFKTGLMKLYKDRTFDARIFQYLFNPTGSTEFDNAILSQSKDMVFSETNISSNGGFFLSDFTQNTDTYQAQTDLNAGYLMLDNALGKRYRLVWGLRAESYYQNTDTRSLGGQDISISNTFLDILPSANLTFTLNEKTNLRFSASRTVSRPELRELSPFTFFDYVTQTSTSGDPNLLRAQITNLDFRYELYPKSGEAITAGVFFKDFSNPIEQILDEGGTPERRQVTFQNAQGARAFGVELEVRKNLGFIVESALLRNLTAFSNLTYIKSEVELGARSNNRSRALQGQSPYLINGGLQYVSGKSGLSFSALYNRVGQRIAFVGNAFFPDVYENPRDVVDLQISKRLLKNNAEIKLNVGDLLNQKSIFYLNMDDKTTYNSSVDKNFTTRTFGTNFSLALTYNLNFNK